MTVLIIDNVYNDVRVSDMPAFNCNVNVSRICDGFESAPRYSYLKQLRIKIFKWHFKM
jgi:hypothetical protein